MCSPCPPPDCLPHHQDSHGIFRFKTFSGASSILLSRLRSQVTPAPAVGFITDASAHRGALRTSWQPLMPLCPRFPCSCAMPGFCTSHPGSLKPTLSASSPQAPALSFPFPAGGCSSSFLPAQAPHSSSWVCFWECICGSPSALPVLSPPVHPTPTFPNTRGSMQQSPTTTPQSSCHTQTPCSIQSASLLATILLPWVALLDSLANLCDQSAGLDHCCGKLRTRETDRENRRIVYLRYSPA